MKKPIFAIDLSAGIHQWTGREVIVSRCEGVDAEGNLSNQKNRTHYNPTPATINRVLRAQEKLVELYRQTP